MKTQPAYKVCRRLGAGVYDKCQTQKYTLSEARHAKGARRGRRRNISDFGKQLLEKQRVRVAYGVNERQLRKYVNEANRVAVLGVDPKERLVEQLEMRLDNVVYRLGFAPTRRAARQMVSHGHVMVNGSRTTVPSRQVAPGDDIALRPRTQNLPLMDKVNACLEDASIPVWLTFDLKKHTGTVAAQPTAEGTEMPGSVGAILEYYSR
jgi:small subunit ribosomal protein S4